MLSASATTEGEGESNNTKPIGRMSRGSFAEAAAEEPGFRGHGGLQGGSLVVAVERFSDGQDGSKHTMHQMNASDCDTQRTELCASSPFWCMHAVRALYKQRGAFVRFNWFLS